MSNEDGHNGDARRLSLLTEEQPRYVVGRSLIHELNERCLELMAQLARSDLTPVPVAVALNRRLWSALDTTARRRIANHPVLLLDLYFANSAWWQWATDPRRVDRKGISAAQLPAKIASELIRETMTLAWTTARIDQRLCTVLFGMTPPVAHQFASFGPLDVERIAARHSRHLRLRYDDHPSFWRTHLLVSSCQSVDGQQAVDIEYPEGRQQRLF